MHGSRSTSRRASTSGGGTDTFAHVAAVDALIETRYTTAIPHGYDLYPVFHFVVGAVEHATGLPSYDALVLTGVLLMTLVVPIAYLLGWSVFGSTRLGLLAALSVTLLEFFAYHALYFYPQALASVLILVALYVNSQLRQAADERSFRRLSVFVIALVATMTITHHLTYLLLGIVAAVAVPVALVRPILFDRELPTFTSAFQYRWLFPGLVGAVFLLAYWAYSPSLITVGIIELTAGLLLSALLLPLPIPIPQIERLKFIVTLVVLFPLSIGLKRALSVDRRYAVVALVVVAAVGGATTFTVLAADDMSETYIDEPREQVTMTDAEYRSIGTTAAFLQQYGDGTAATDRVTNRAFETVGFNATSPLQALPSGLRTDATYLVVREHWTDHIVALGQGLRSGDLNKFTLSQERFDTVDRTRDKVYTTGHVRVYRSDDGFEDVYGTNGTAR